MARPTDTIFLLILAGALVLRVYLAATAPYIHDEDNTAIPLSQTISFSPGTLNLPLRGENHGALPAYIVKVSGTLFGTSPLGYRALHVVIGLATIVLIFWMVRDWYGDVAARWAAALMAFNEYHLTMSARASANAPFLFLVTAAVLAFSRFLATQRAVHLYAAAAATGLAFYCKEHAVLLGPVFLAMLLRSPYRHRTAHAYAAALLFALLVAPDVLWNLRTDPDEARVTYDGDSIGQATYSAHLKRVGGIGMSPYPLVFYARGAVTAAYHAATGQELSDVTSEYHAVNSALGLLLLGGVLWSIVAPGERDAMRLFLLIMACGIFLFFTLIKKGDAPYRLTPVNWVWVEATLIPAVMLTGTRLATVGAKWRTPAWGLAALVLFYAVDAVWRASA